MRWTRAIIGGVLAELLLAVVVLVPALAIGIETLQDPKTVPTGLLAVVVVGSFVAPLLLTQWVARRVGSRFVLHGGIVGLSAFVFYMIPVVAGGALDQQTASYWLAHAMKILGGLTGGLVAAQRHARRPATAAV